MLTNNCGQFQVNYSLYLCFSANNELFSPPKVGCACPNEHLIFNCTAVGSLGSTIWRVAAFDCVQNEIILRHSEYNSVGTTGLCNGGAINGTSIRVEGNCYISQLNVTVTPELHNKTVTCLVTSSGVISPISNVSVIVASGNNILHVCLSYPAVCTCYLILNC